MARARKGDRCKGCGDVAGVDPDTFAPLDTCAACAAPTVRTAVRTLRADRAADRVTVTVRVARIACPTCKGPLHVSHCTPEVAQRRGYQCDGCADRAEGRGWDY